MTRHYLPPLGGRCLSAHTGADEGFPHSRRQDAPPGHARAVGTPSMGVHGSGGLRLACKDQPRIAARSLGASVTGAAAPRAARIGVTLQALGAATLCQLGPPGRRRCRASEIPGRLMWLGNGVPHVGATCGRPPRAEGALRRRPKLRIVRFAASGKAHSLRWASSPHRTRSAGLRRGPLFAAGKLPVEQLGGYIQ